MRQSEIVFLWVNRVGLLATLVGVLWRRRHNQCLSFVAYLVVVLVCGTLTALWPQHFYTPEFWMISQSKASGCRPAIRNPTGPP